MTVTNEGSGGKRREGSPQYKIVPHLWFDDQAQEAVEFYTSLFEDSRTGAVTRYGSEGFEIHGQPQGKLMTVEFELAGHPFIALNGGPHFRFTPALSLFVTLETQNEVDELWRGLSEGGTALMELDEYPWSERYGWVQDRFGLSWQVQLGDVDSIEQRIVPCLMFTAAQPQAEQAIELYSSLFPNAGIDSVHYAEEQPGQVLPARFHLAGQAFIATDGGAVHDFSFNEAISLLILCESQAEIDHYWEGLSTGGDPKAQRCGWLKDRFGVSWQVSPRRLQEMLQDPDPQRVQRVTRAFLQMKKFDVDALESAFDGQAG